ncbi:MAG: amino acid adenylation domain-containing protein [Verrucomicrobiales bacterium]|nr:amino acid adenylation domain-containing protein [Verrucomicrobiales bacterium]
MHGQLPEPPPGHHQSQWAYERHPSHGLLLPHQAGIRALCQLTQPGVGQSVVRLVRLDGLLRIELLRGAFLEVFKHHDVLRVQIVETAEGVRQIGRSNWLPELTVTDLSPLDRLSQEAEYRRYFSEETERILDLAHDPLVRGRLVILGERSHLLLLCGHRIVLDQSSIDGLARQLFSLYGTLSDGAGFRSAFSTEGGAPWPGSTGVVLARPTAWDERDLTYWKAKLEGAPTLLELPLDRPRSLTRCGPVGCVTHRISSPLREALERIGQQSDTNFEAVLIASFQVLLSRHTGCSDLLLGVRMLMSDTAGEPGLSGFSNTIPLRGDFSDDPSFFEHLRRTAQTLMESMEHPSLTFGLLVEAMVVEPPRGHAPLVQYMLSVRPSDTRVSAVGELELRELEWPRENAGLDLSIWADVSAEEVVLSADYRMDLFDQGSIVRLLQRFEVLLGSLTQSPDLAVSRHQMLTEGERQQVLAEWNQTSGQYPSQSTYAACFERTVSAMPSAIAVSAAGKEMCYAELNRSANRLAHFLQKSGVMPETLVGVCLDRSFDLAISLLGILKAGGAFMPLDPAYPKQRLRLMIEDAKPLLILTHARHLAGLPADPASVVCLDAASFQATLANCPADQAPDSQADADSLAYVIYTSGSTGKPNGVEITQRSMVNHSHAVAGAYQLSTSDRVLQFAALSFDIAVEEIFPSWLQGSAVVFRSEGAISSTQRFFEFLELERISIINIPTAYWHQLVDDLGACSFPARVTRVVVGGEQASLTKWKAWREHTDPKVSFYNSYGPTEATVTSTIHKCENAGDLDSLPIGKPIANTRVYVLDSHRQPVGIGVAGELFIAGDCLARGYRGNPHLTAERFVSNPHDDRPEARMYRTGDLVRWTIHGSLEFLGRADAQLKVRGYRIEPGEVEASLQRHPNVHSCVVVGEDRGDQGKELVAYLVARSAVSLTVSGLRQWLADHVSDYMIPSRFFVLPALPLTPAGKVDRRGLSTSRGEELPAGSVHAAATTPLECELVRVWQSVLNKARIGIDDHFFDLGGNSLLASQVFASLESALGKRLPLSLLFEAPTIRAIARRLEDQEWKPTWDCLVPLQTGVSGQPVFLVHGIKGNVVGFHSLARELGVDRPVYGLQAQGLDGVQPAIQTIEDMARLYLQRLQAVHPEGPYHLIGLSFGGLVAYEMAQQLKAMGRSVGLVGILDTFPTGYDQHLGWRARLENFCGTVVSKLKAHWTLHAREGLRGLPWILRERWQTLCRWVQPIWSPLRGKGDSASGTAVADPSVLVERLNHQACDRYAVCPYPGKVALFIAAESPPSIKELLRKVWKPLPVEGVDVYESPGDHNTIVEPPNDRVLAGKLRSCLREFENGSS